jgi:putative phosphoesterase
MSTRVLVLADTHVPDFARALPPALCPHVQWADRILHAGDATTADVLVELAAHAPVDAVVGNIDDWSVPAWGAKHEAEVEVEGVRIAMIHDAGRRHGREERLRARFPAAAVIVFAHSHEPVNSRRDGVWFLNPGSPTWKRRAPEPTVARLVVSDGRVESIDLVPLRVA